MVKNKRIDTVPGAWLTARRAGEGDGPELPAADLGLVSGGVASEEQRAILLAMRRSCRTLIALGTCATHGGIPALANERSQAAVRAGVFADCGTAPAEAPACLERVYAVDEVVRPDLCVPGCPPRPEALLEGFLKLQEKIRQEQFRWSQWR